MQFDTVGVKIFCVDVNAAPVLAEIHDVADIGCWSENVRLDKRLLRGGDLSRVGIAGGIVDRNFLAV